MDANEKLKLLKDFRAGMNGKNHFELLGVSEDCGDADVRRAYFELMKRYGADYFHHVVDKEGKAAVEEVNRQLRVAYDTIGKAESRQIYLAGLKEGGSAQTVKNIDIASVFELEQALSLSRSLMERGDFKVALGKLEKAHMLDDRSLEVQARLCYCRYMLMEVDGKNKRDPEQVKRVREKLEALCDAIPNADYLRVYLGDLENLDGDPEKSLKWYQQAHELNPDNLAAKRALMMVENRAKTQQETSEKPQGLWERIKSLLNKKW